MEFVEARQRLDQIALLDGFEADGAHPVFLGARRVAWPIVHVLRERRDGLLRSFRHFYRKALDQLFIVHAINIQLIAVSVSSGRSHCIVYPQDVANQVATSVRLETGRDLLHSAVRGNESKPTEVPRTTARTTRGARARARPAVSFQVTRDSNTALLPFFITLAIGEDPTSSSGSFTVIRVLRLARVLRIFKLGKYSQDMKTFALVMKKSSPALTMMSYFMAIAIVLFGSMIYFAEVGDYDPESGLYLRDDLTGAAKEESPFQSIPHSFWFVAVTATTTGYGDVYPTSPAGKAVATICMYLGVLVLALPITIIGLNFTEAYEASKMEQRFQQELHLNNQARIQTAQRRWSHAYDGAPNARGGVDAREAQGRRKRILGSESSNRGAHDLRGLELAPLTISAAGSGRGDGKTGGGGGNGAAPQDVPYDDEEARLVSHLPGTVFNETHEDESVSHQRHARQTPHEQLLAFIQEMDALSARARAIVATLERE